MKRIFITTIMLCICGLGFAQNIAVESFSINENDQEARVISPRKDQNNRVSAIIKLETPLPLQNFTFESGSIGIVATRQEKGEIWIYMPVGAQRLTIKHGQLGVVRDYSFGEPLREATVYIMKLKSGNVKTIVEDDVNLQYFVVNCSIDGATIKIDEGDPESFSTGKFQKLLSYGKHKYIIEAPLYHPLVGNIEITTSKSELTPEMKPMFGTLTLNTQPEQGADIFIDGEKRGQTPLTINRMKSGEYSIQVVKNLFLPATEKTTVTDGRNHNLNITLKPNFAVITLNGLGDIYVNDEQKGNGKWTGKLTPGTYKVEVMKTSHRPSVTSIIVKAGEDKTIDLQTPTPVYGSLDIKSNIDAVVFIDGEKQQETTPAIIKKVLIGKHEIKLQANGYEPYTQTIEVVEGKLFAMNSTLQKKGNSIFNIPAATMKDDYDMVFVSGGTFTMGCTSEQGSDCFDNEKPAHRVKLSSFYIGKYEVTQKQWKDIMGTNPSY
ncbi:MAG: PEGA domain-containing protein, partial [Bacteroidales bacterium]|nr:PEGA domain-containing protein [Bacteroidales bacterium]